MMNLETEFQQIDTMIGEYMNAAETGDSRFNVREYIKLTRHVRFVLRREMLNLKIADASKLSESDSWLSPKIRDSCLELDLVAVQHAIQGNFIEEYNSLLQLYDILRAYSNNPTDHRLHQTKSMPSTPVQQAPIKGLGLAPPPMPPLPPVQVSDQEDEEEEDY